MNAAPTVIGTYVVLESIGRGGSSCVYRAYDARLRRDVAIKVLKTESTDSLGPLRLVREARAASALNHPNILTIHDIVPDAAPPYIVSELVEGKTLRDVIDEGPLTADRVIAIATQIADGLAAAHHVGLVHRDLKPENVMVTREGRAKILDFGLARTTTTVVTDDETITAPHMVVGTAPYMSPEQARGATLDSRSDIFSFGAIAYEMVSGQRAFQRATTIDTLSAILHESPLPLDAGGRPMNERLGQIIDRCLAKNPGERYAATADLLYDLKAVTATSLVPRSRRPRILNVPAALLAAVVTGVVITFPYSERSAEIPSISRLLVGIAPADALSGSPSRTSVALSPDGRILVFSAFMDGRQQLFRRAMDRLDAEPIPGTDNGINPFFSPDGQWVAFWSGEVTNGSTGELKRVRLDGSRPVVIASVAPVFGGSWSAGGLIVFADANGILQVPAEGGVPQPIPPLTPSGGESYRLPQVLPSGDILFTQANGRAPHYLSQARIGVLSRATGRARMLIDDGVDARFAEPDQLIFVRAGTLMAVTFDAKRLTVRGVPRPIVAGVGQAVSTGLITAGDTFAGEFAVSPTGTVAYVPAVPRAPGRRSVKLIDQRGVATTLPIQPKEYLGPRLSPDGRSLLLSDLGSSFTFSIYEISDRTVTPLRTELRGFWGIWSPDARNIVFGSDRPGGVLEAAVHGNSVETLVRPQGVPAVWSRDGQTLVLVRLRPSTQWEILLWSKTSGTRSLHSTAREHSERYPTLSPDGGWIAYTSDESGNDEVYIERFPGGAGRRKVSSTGGVAPAWSPDARQLFYVSPGVDSTVMVAVPVQTTPSLRIGPVERRFPWPYSVGSPMRSYDIAPDGSHFIALLAEPASPAPPSRNIVIVLNGTRPF